MSIDRRYKKVAERLHLYELTAADADLVADPTVEKSAARLAELYTRKGIVMALETYGVADALRGMGLGDFEVSIEQTDRFRSRLHVTVPADDHALTVCDLRLHLVELAVSDHERPVGAVAIDWLAMQNPRAAFSPERPALPGQAHPGTGLGRSMHNMLQLMCLRIGREALVVTPERWHLAHLYGRGGYRFRSVQRQRDHDAVSEALQPYHFAAAAWAVEWGLVCSEPEGTAYRYDPAPMVLALSPTLKLDLAMLLQTLRRSWTTAAPAYAVDEDRLRARLLEHGLDALTDDRMYQWGSGA